MKTEATIPRDDRRGRPAATTAPRFEIMIWGRPDLPGVELEAVLARNAERN